MKSANYCEFQSVYRKGYSTETALLRVVNDIQRADGNGQCTALLALDISSAFDAVDHATLTDSDRTASMTSPWIGFDPSLPSGPSRSPLDRRSQPCSRARLAYLNDRSYDRSFLVCTCHLSAMSCLNTTFNATNMQMTCNYSFQSLRPSNIRIQQSGLVT